MTQAPGPRFSSRDGRCLGCVVVLLGLLAAPAVAGRPTQDGREVFPEVDPYTRGAPDALEKAGYASLGPFIWGDDHSTTQVEETLGGISLIWVETDHFRLGSSLETYAVVEDQDERERVRAELRRLRKLLPRVKTNAWKLDPWLRLHLYAMRLEELYAEFVERLKIRHEDYCSHTDGSCPRPYLGLREKFGVLLLEKRSGLARYVQTYLGGESSTSYRYYFDEVDSLFYGISFESMEDAYHNDSALHCAVVFGVVENLTSAFRGYTHEAPLWWRTGLARWFMRRIDPRWQLYASKPGETAPGEEQSDWAPKVRSRVLNRYFPTTAEMLAWKDPAELDFGNHMIVWSRVDYLLSSQVDAAHALLMSMKEPIPWETPEPRELVIEKQCRRAFEDATGMKPEEFDQAWASWVCQRYPR